MASRYIDEDSSNKPPLLLGLPMEILEKILSYFTYDETSVARLVSKRFDSICRARLNDGLHRVDRLHSQIHREVKGKLPRRESERRNHSLARHIDILSAIETRLSLLNMTYSKYIDMGLCCFIPGKVLDEMFHVLHEIRRVSNPPRAHELLQELRDISSMAMEHFDEKIVPLLKQESHTVACPRFNYSSMISSVSSESISRKHRLQKSQAMVIQLGQRLSSWRKFAQRESRKLRKLEKKLVEQSTVCTELEQHKVDQDRRIAELEQKIVDYGQKFADMNVEITRVRTACGGADGNITQVTKDGKLEPASEIGTSESELKTCNVGQLPDSSAQSEEIPSRNGSRRGKLNVKGGADLPECSGDDGASKSQSHYSNVRRDLAIDQKAVVHEAVPKNLSTAAKGRKRKAAVETSNADGVTKKSKC